MKIAPVAPVSRPTPEGLPVAAPVMLAFVARVQDITDHTPNRAINVIVFAGNAQSAHRVVDAMLGMPTQWRALRIEINLERLKPLDGMANLTPTKRLACTFVEVEKALRLLDNHDAGYWRSQRITPGLTARVEIRSWLR